MEQKVKIILAESQELFRISLATLLNTNTEFKVTASVGDGKQLLESLKEAQANMVILDVDLPVIDGRDAFAVIKNRFPDIKVIILSSRTDNFSLSDFMMNGANSYLNKNCGAQNLFTAIKTVNREGYYLDGYTSRQLLDAMKAGTSQTEIRFNERETQILRKICDGKTNREIATSLHLSASTIDFHRSRIYSKAKCNNVVGLVKYALKNGLIAYS